jgi:tetratricopeptide (TPR) repeat protein
MRRALFLLLLITPSLITSCATAPKSGKELSDHGDYEGAEAAYQKALEANPKDTDAKTGLYNMRSKLLDAQIEKIRKARIAGENIVQKILDIMDLENKWGVQPSREGLYQQSDESDRASSQALVKLSDSSLESFPLKRETELAHVARLFKESHSWDYSVLKIRTQNEGKKLCQDFIRKSAGSFPYLDSFTTRFCNHWNAGTSPKADPRVISHDLVSAVVVSFDIKNFPEQTRNQITVRLNDALQTTPWYSQAGSRPFNISIRGTWEDSSKIKMHLEGEGQLGNRSIQLSLKDESEIPSDSSHAQKWLDSHLAELAHQFSGTLKSAWNDMYCADIPVEEFAFSGDLVQKCRRVESASSVTPAFIDAWYLKYLGMDRKSTDLILKKGSG